MWYRKPVQIYSPFLKDLQITAHISISLRVQATSEPEVVSWEANELLPYSGSASSILIQTPPFAYAVI